MKQAILVVLLVLLAACASGGGLVSNDPTDMQVSDVRFQAVRVVDSAKAGVELLSATGELLDTFPNSVADRFDCALMKATGTTGPASPAVVSVCGAVPLTSASPVGRLAAGAGNLATCPGLKATAAAVYDIVAPLIALLEASPEKGLQLAAVSLRVSFAVMAPGGVTCH